MKTYYNVRCTVCVVFTKPYSNSQILTGLDMRVPNAFIAMMTTVKLVSAGRLLITVEIGDIDKEVTLRGMYEV